MHIDFVRGKTHSSEYSWHKYWSRKPANVIATYLDALVPDGGTVLDPFSGSGVVLREATRLGFDCRAFDVNPIAVEISKFMICNLDVETFRERAGEIISEVESDLGTSYLEQGKPIRFVVHHMATHCSNCGLENVYSKTDHVGRTKSCTRCKSKISFGLANFSRTVINEIAFVDGSMENGAEVIAQQTAASVFSGNLNSLYSEVLVNNRRTLTSNSLRTSDFFTARNFSILAACADLAHACQDEELRRGLLLLITGTSAQASRLIASRGRLASGGQAWTIPGFWVPPIHLESNPFIHLRARAKKMEQALEEIREERRAEGRVHQVSALLGMRESSKKSEKFDLIFLDPPYGDSVAFTEFSAIWNAFLKRQVNYHEDISVSDRSESPFSMTEYEEALRELSAALRESITESGKVLVTFNNHDLRAWRALVAALQAAGFSASFVRYHDPAVVSAKSQKALSGSYVGDFYVVFAPGTSPVRKLEQFRGDIRALLVRAAEARGGRLSRALAVRFGLQMWLEANIDASDIVEFDSIVMEAFEETRGDLLLINLPEVQPTQIQEIVLKHASGRDLGSVRGVSDFLTAVEREAKDLGLPSPSEAIAMVAHARTQDQLW